MFVIKKELKISIFHVLTPNLLEVSLTLSFS